MSSPCRRAAAARVSACCRTRNATAGARRGLPSAACKAALRQGVGFGTSMRASAAQTSQCRLHVAAGVASSTRSPCALAPLRRFPATMHVPRIARESASSAGRRCIGLHVSLLGAAQISDRSTHCTTKRSHEQIQESRIPNGCKSCRALPALNRPEQLSRRLWQDGICPKGHMPTRAICAVVGALQCRAQRAAGARGPKV